jgi:hypothetical protein
MMDSNQSDTVNFHFLFLRKIIQIRTLAAKRYSLCINPEPCRWASFPLTNFLKLAPHLIRSSAFGQRSHEQTAGCGNALRTVRTDGPSSLSLPAQG